MPTKIEKDEISGRDTTGHDWDGVKELDTPLPKWWLYVFYATIAFAAVYMVLFPAWPGFSSYTKGLLGFSQRAETQRSLAELVTLRAPMMNRIKAASLEEIQSNAELLNFAINGGRTVFADNCATCHGSGGAGNPGFPVLADDDWSWGGKLKDIWQTVAYGVRNANDKSRQSAMPRFGADGVLTPVQIDDTAEYVLSLTNRSTNPSAAQRGKQLFDDNCSSCHQEGGKGNQELGAPRLNDRIWLYGGDKSSIVATIWYSHSGNMPAWSERFDEATIKMLTVYVHALGGGN
jgi:cytochrome c oxidase cbb3-type subunit 3